MSDDASLAIGLDGAEEFQIVFDGRIASQGLLHYYEFGRSQYATARFVAVIERFRRDGSILQRISSVNYVNILVETPRPGSFIETIIIPVGTGTAAAVLAVPLSAIVSYVWHLLVPRKRSTDDLLLQMAEIRLAEEQQRSVQMTEIRRIVEAQQISPSEAMKLLAWARDSKNTALGRIGVDQRRVLLLTNEMRVEKNRIENFAAYSDEIAQIDSEKILELTSRIRPIVKEMALPLRRSAETLAFGTKSEKDRFVQIDREDAEQIALRQIDDETVHFECHIRSFDRDSGVGKLTGPQFSHPMGFTIPLTRRNLLRDSILEAMRLDIVDVEARRIIDGSGGVVSFILENISF